MGCFATIDFAPAAGAHLSFYWTMNEAGTTSKADSTQGLLWPLENGAAAGTGLFSNGTHCDPNLVLNHHRGLLIPSTATIQIIQANSKGVGVWFWIEPLVFQALGGLLEFYMDTSNPLHSNFFRLLVSSPTGTTTTLELQHTNDIGSSIIDSPNLSWALNTWHMIAFNYDKVAQTIAIYVDGVLSISGADTQVYPDLTSTVLELANYTAPGGTQDFMVDECGLCLNAPLTAAQITSLWNGGAGVTYPGVTAIVPFP